MKKQEKLFLAIGNIDPELLVESEVPHRPKFAPLVVACACLLIVFGVAAAVVPLLRPKDPIDTIDPITNEPATSEKYSTLSELLSALSVGEDHGKDELASVRKGGVDCSSQMSSAAIFGDYSYHISKDSGVIICKLEGENTHQVGKIDGYFSGVLVLGEYLAAFSTEDTSFETGEAPETLVKLFDLSDPTAPKETSYFELGGALRTAFLHNGQLFVLHSDGVCACGWSRTKDEEDYKPVISVNEKDFTISEDDISILGDPVRVEYTAITCIGQNGSYISTKVLYGNIEDVFVFDDEIIFNVVESDMMRSSPSALYRFKPNEKGVAYTGCVYLADALEIDRKGIAHTLSGSYAELVEVFEENGTLRLVGEQYDFSMNKLKASSLFCVTVLPNGSTHTARSKAENSELPISIDELIYDKECIVLTYSMYNPDRMSKKAFVSYITQKEGSAQFASDKLEVSYIDGIDGYMSVGKPYGEFNTMLKIEDGRYLRSAQNAKGFELISIGKNGISCEKYSELQEGEVCMLKTLVNNGSISAFMIGKPYFNGENYKFWNDKSEYRWAFFDAEGKNVASLPTTLEVEQTILEHNGVYYLFNGEPNPSVLPVG